MTKTSKTKRCIMMGASILALTFGAGAANAQAAPTTFNIEAQPLQTALLDFNEQSGIIVIASQDLITGKTAPAINGMMEPDDALAIILAGSGLKSTQNNTGAYTITLAKAEVEKADPKPFRVAQLDQEETGTVERISDRDDEDDSPRVEDTIVVTGTNIRGGNPAAPTLSFGKEDFIEGGFTTLQDVFRNVPQNFGDVSPAGALTSGVSGIATSNADRANGISLRGLGPESTLVLVNGRRYPGAINGRVFDISSIPLSAIERVEIVMGGNSAIYGSDAVAGVVNLIPRRSFDGFEAQGSYGFSEGGNEKVSVNAIFGLTAEKGGFIAAYDYTKQTALDATEAVAIGGSPFGIVPIPGVMDLVPDRDRHSVFVAGEYNVNDSVEIFGDVLFSDSSTNNSTGFIFFGSESRALEEIDVEQIVGTGGLKAELPGAWTLDLTGTYGNRETDFSSESSFGAGPISSTQSATTAELAQLTAVIQGTAFRMGDVDIQTALGFEYRDESFAENLVNENRSITSVFGEVRIPLVENGSKPGLHRLEITAAARYDDYSDFGDTFNPQFGAIWQPLEGLIFRGTYASAFRAPSLFLQGSVISRSRAFLQPITDPTSPAGTSNVLQLFGTSDNLQPEEADTFTVGFDYSPSYFDDVEISVSFFDINYDGRLETPAAGGDRFTFLQNEARFASLINRNPTEAEARLFFDRALAAGPGQFRNLTSVPFDPNTQDFLTVFPDLVLFNNQRTNIAVEGIQGLDFEINSSFETGLGKLLAGLSGVYYFDYERSITPTSPAFSLLNDQGKLVDFRTRAHLGWQRGALSAHTFINYTDGYQNTGVTPAQNVNSWTTVDLTLRYDGSSNGSGILNEGFGASVNFSNIFNETPPFLDGNLRGIAFDGANHNPFGRVVTFQITKSW